MPVQSGYAPEVVPGNVRVQHSHARHRVHRAYRHGGRAKGTGNQDAHDAGARERLHLSQLLGVDDEGAGLEGGPGGARG